MNFILLHNIDLIVFCFLITGQEFFYFFSLKILLYIYLHAFNFNFDLYLLHTYRIEGRVDSSILFVMKQV